MRKLNITVSNVSYEADGDDVSDLPTSYSFPSFEVEDDMMPAEISDAVIDHISEISGYLVADCSISWPV